MKSNELYGELCRELQNFAPQSRFYSVREIMHRYSINQRAVVNTIRKLEKNGLVVCRPNVGIFCSAQNTSFKRRLLFLSLDWPSPCLELWKKQLRLAAERSGRWILHTVSYPAETPIPKISTAGYDAVCINRPAAVDREFLTWLSHFPVPVILTGCRVGDFNINSLNGMDEFSGNMLAKYLFDKGHRKVLLFNSEPENSCIALRKQGFCNAASLFGMEVMQLDCGTMLGEFSMQRGYEYLSCYLDEHSGEFSAIFMTTSPMAEGVYRALAEHGLSVPDDISVVGCDRVIPEGLSPELTQVDLHEFPEVRVFEQLERVIAGEINCFHIEIPPIIREGKSVKNLISVNINQERNQK